MKNVAFALGILLVMPSLLEAADVGRDPDRVVRGTKSGKYADDYFRDLEPFIPALGGGHIPAIDTLARLPQSDLYHRYHEHAANPKYVARLLWCKNFRLGTAEFCVNPNDIVDTTNDQRTLLLLWLRLLIDDEVLDDDGRPVTQEQRLASLDYFLVNPALDTASLWLLDGDGRPDKQRNIFHALMTNVMIVDPTIFHRILLLFENHRRLPSTGQLCYLAPMGTFGDATERTTQSLVMCTIPFAGVSRALFECFSTSFLKFVFRNAHEMIRQYGHQAQDYLFVAAIARADQETLDRVVSAPTFDIDHFYAHPAYWSALLDRGPGGAKRFFGQLGKGFGIGLLGAVALAVRPHHFVVGGDVGYAGGVPNTSSFSIANIRKLKIGQLRCADGSRLCCHIANRANAEWNHQLFDRLWFERDTAALVDVLQAPGFDFRSIDSKTLTRVVPAGHSVLERLLRKLVKKKYNDRIRPGGEPVRTALLQALCDGGVPLTFARMQEIGNHSLRNDCLTIWTPRLLAHGDAGTFDFLWDRALAEDTPSEAFVGLLAAPDFSYDWLFADRTRVLGVLNRSQQGSAALAHLADAAGEQLHHKVLIHCANDAAIIYHLFSRAVAQNRMASTQRTRQVILDIMTSAPFAQHLLPNGPRNVYRALASLPNEDGIAASIDYTLGRLRHLGFAPSAATLMALEQSAASNAQRVVSSIRGHDLDVVLAASSLDQQVALWQGAVTREDWAALRQLYEQPSFNHAMYADHAPVMRALIRNGDLRLAELVDNNGVPLYQRFLNNNPNQDAIYDAFAAALRDEDEDAIVWLFHEQGHFAPLRRMLRALARAACSANFIHTVLDHVRQAFALYAPRADDIAAIAAVPDAEAPHKQVLSNIFLAPLWRDRILEHGDVAEQELFLRHALAHPGRTAFVDGLFASPHFHATQQLANGIVPLEWLIRHAPTQDDACRLARQLVAARPDENVLDFRNVYGCGLRAVAEARGWPELFTALHDATVEARFPEMRAAVAAVRAKITALADDAAPVGGVLLIEAPAGMDISRMVNELAQELLGKEMVTVPPVAPADAAEGSCPEKVVQALEASAVPVRRRVPRSVLFADELAQYAPPVALVPVTKHATYARKVQNLVDELEAASANKTVFIATTADRRALQPMIREQFNLLPERNEVVSLGPLSPRSHARTVHRAVRMAPRYHFSAAHADQLARETARWLPADLQAALNAARGDGTAFVDYERIREAFNQQARAIALREGPEVRPQVILAQGPAAAGAGAPVEGTFGSLVGCDEEVLVEFNDILTFLRQEGAEDALRRVLLHGPSGVGKTSLVEELYQQAGCHYEYIHAGRLGSEDEACDRLEDAFRVARTKVRALIFIDEYDNISSAAASPRVRTLVQRLLDELAADDSVVVVCATNYRNTILEPARRRLENLPMPLPNAAQRVALLRHFCQQPGVTVAPAVLTPVVMQELATQAEGRTPYQIKESVTRAQRAARRIGGVSIVTNAHLQRALERAA